ncbi:hypothetical protein L3X38_015268 [Prunus dulcis]|uniref:Uncharacterized protein n=1 Tax=Prunus dulcis TaxID=3755 RepID=A0AAD4WRF1_PRUDU|nr:hypothetical protein L3X38_015268 [Prunus dulcis]
MLCASFLSNLIGISKALHIFLCRLTSFERAIILPIERSAGLVIFLSCLTWDFSLLVNFEAQKVGVNHQLFTFCYLFFSNL